MPERTARDADRRLTPGAQRILDVASELFYARGIHAVGVDTIAAESGVTKRTLYDRFGSKDALVTAYLERRDSRWRELIERRLAPQRDPVGRVLAPFDVLPEWLSGSPRGCSFVNAFAEIPELDHPGRRLVVEEKTWLRDLFARLLAEAGVAEPNPVATALTSLHEGAIVCHSIVGDQGTATATRAAAEILVRAALSAPN